MRALPQADRVPSAQVHADAVVRILDLARWTPSGDNVQPWRFRRTGPEVVRLDTVDLSREIVYDLDGRSGLTAFGMLLETIRIAATTEGRRTRIEPLPGGNPRAPSFLITFHPSTGLPSDPLAEWIRIRSVHRGVYARRALTALEVTRLEASVGRDFHLVVFGGGHRHRWASLNQRAAHLRLDTRELWELTGKIIEWDAQRSIDRIPDQALGIPVCMLGLARHLLDSWPMTRFVNRYLAGTVMPRLLLDWWPSVRCGAHLAIQAVKPVDQPEGWLSSGAAIQRLWLTATALGLRHQPGMTALIFARYARDRIHFSDDPKAPARTHALRRDLCQLLGADALERTVWMGRIGAAPAAAARSTRLGLESLYIDASAGSAR